MKFVLGPRVDPLRELLLVLGSAGTLWYFANAFVGSQPFYLHVATWCIYLYMMAFIWWLQRKRSPGRPDLGLNKAKWQGYRTILWSLAVAAIAIISFVASGMIVMNFLGSAAPPDLSGYDFIKNNPLLMIGMFLAVYISSSLGEEVVYRGFLITRFNALFNFKGSNLVAVFISGLIFGLAHWGWGPMGMIQTAFMGWALGYAYIRLKRNLWATVLAHGYMDTLLLIQIATAG